MSRPACGSVGVPGRRRKRVQEGIPGRCGPATKPRARVLSRLNCNRASLSSRHTKIPQETSHGSSTATQAWRLLHRRGSDRRPRRLQRRSLRAQGHLPVRARRGQRRPARHQRRVLDPLRARRRHAREPSRWSYTCRPRPTSPPCSAHAPLVANGDWDNTVRAKVTGLPANTPLFYRFVAGSRRQRRRQDQDRAVGHRHGRTDEVRLVHVPGLVGQPLGRDVAAGGGRPRLHRARGRLHLRDRRCHVPGRCGRAGAHGAVAARRHRAGHRQVRDHAGRLPVPVSHLPRRRAPAHAAPAVADDRDLGRPRVQRRLLAGSPDLHQRQPAADGAPPRRVAGLAGVPADRLRRRVLRHRQRGLRQHPHLPRLPVRQPDAPGDDRRTPVPRRPRGARGRDRAGAGPRPDQRQRLHRRALLRAAAGAGAVRRAEDAGAGPPVVDAGHHADAVVEGHDLRAGRHVEGVGQRGDAQSPVGRPARSWRRRRTTRSTSSTAMPGTGIPATRPS